MPYVRTYVFLLCSGAAACDLRHSASIETMGTFQSYTQVSVMLLIWCRSQGVGAEETNVPTWIKFSNSGESELKSLLAHNFGIAASPLFSFLRCCYAY